MCEEGAPAIEVGSFLGVALAAAPEVTEVDGVEGVDDGEGSLIKGTGTLTRFSSFAAFAPPFFPFFLSQLVIAVEAV